MGRVIAAAAYNAGCRVADIPVEDSGQWAAQPGHFVWIGIEAPSEPDLRQLQAQFGLHELALEDALNAHQRPRLETYGVRWFRPQVSPLCCQVAEHCWDPAGHSIATYGYLFDRLIQARQREV